MLWDLRSIFREKNNPEYLATSDLLSELRKIESRPWSGWGAKSGRRIASLLRPFGILPEHLNPSEGQFRGYLVRIFRMPGSGIFHPVLYAWNPMNYPPWQTEISGKTD